MEPGIVYFPVLIRRKRHIEISENLRNNFVNFLPLATFQEQQSVKNERRGKGS